MVTRPDAPSCYRYVAMRLRNCDDLSADLRELGRTFPLLLRAWLRECKKHNRTEKKAVKASNCSTTSWCLIANLLAPLNVTPRRFPTLARNRSGKGMKAYSSRWLRQLQRLFPEQRSDSVARLWAPNRWWFHCRPHPDRRRRDCSCLPCPDWSVQELRSNPQSH